MIPLEVLLAPAKRRKIAADCARLILARATDSETKAEAQAILAALMPDKERQS